MLAGETTRLPSPSATRRYTSTLNAFTEDAAAFTWASVTGVAGTSEASGSAGASEASGSAASEASGSAGASGDWGAGGSSDLGSDASGRSLPDVRGSGAGSDVVVGVAQARVSRSGARREEGRIGRL